MPRVSTHRAHWHAALLARLFLATGWRRSRCDLQQVDRRSSLAPRRVALSRTLAPRATSLVPRHRDGVLTALFETLPLHADACRYGRRYARGVPRRLAESARCAFSKSSTSSLAPSTRGFRRTCAGAQQDSSPDEVNMHDSAQSASSCGSKPIETTRDGLIGAAVMLGVTFALSTLGIFLKRSGSPELGELLTRGSRSVRLARRVDDLHERGLWWRMPLHLGGAALAAGRHLRRRRPGSALAEYSPVLSRTRSA